MKMKFISCAVAATLSAVAVPASADVIIDSFTTNQGPITVSNAIGVGGPVSSGWNAVSTAGTDIIGGSREMMIVKTFGNGSQAITANVSDGVLNYSVDSLAKGTGYLRWDGVADGLTGFGLNKDFTTEKTISLWVDFSDADYQFTVGLYTDANRWSVFNGTADSVGDVGSGAIWSSPHEFTFDLSLYLTAFGDPSTGVGYMTCGAGGCVDLANVNAIEAVIDPNAKRTALDLTLNKVNLVSEPASGALAALGIGMGLMGALRRKKSQ